MVQIYRCFGDTAFSIFRVDWVVSFSERDYTASLPETNLKFYTCFNFLKKNLRFAYGRLFSQLKYGLWSFNKVAPFSAFSVPAFLSFSPPRLPLSFQVLPQWPASNTRPPPAEFQDSTQSTEEEFRLLSSEHNRNYYSWWSALGWKIVTEESINSKEQNTQKQGF
jgi:hypothetical protein